MDGTKEWDSIEYEEEYVRQCNLSYNRLLRQERERRNITQQGLCKGILNRYSLERIESGEAGWTKLTGDTLMQRMGIATEYFEMVSSGEELDRWRMREDICLLVPSRPAEARAKLEEYRQKYRRRVNIEEQFLGKAEIILLLSEWEKRSGQEERSEQEEKPEWEESSEREQKIKEELLRMGQEAVGYTIPDGIDHGIEKLWLSPAELEAVLLLGAVYMVCGRKKEADGMWKDVWEYPEIHHWEERMAVLILPQAALLGMALAMKENDYGKAFNLGKEALELLRRNYSQCYLLPLLDCLGKISGQNQEEKAYLEKAAEFGACFRKLYKGLDIPYDRLWQSIGVDNTRDAGTVLQMLRKFDGKSHAKAVYDGEAQVITPRHLMRLESGLHKPSREIYEQLLKQYGKSAGWWMTLVETDSLDDLEQRQKIATMIGFGQWEQAEREITNLCKRLDEHYPRVKQELLLWKALFKWEKENALEESLEMLRQALRCTMPDMEGKNLKWWVFQREETMIVNNMVRIFRKLGCLKEAQMWAEDTLHSLKQQSIRTNIALTGYDILMGSYDNVLADSGFMKEVLEVDQEAIRIYLKSTRIRCLASMCYRIAWNIYEIASQDTEKWEAYHPLWKEAYHISEVLAEYIYDSQRKAFLQEDSRRKKFLN